MTDTDFAICTSCRKPKNQLKQKKSKVLGVPMFLCQSCIDAKYEPRPFLVLAGRQAVQNGDQGLSTIAYWIKPKRYCGEPITVRELT